jgi:Family of unknown function (DUF5996)
MVLRRRHAGLSSSRRPGRRQTQEQEHGCRASACQRSWPPLPLVEWKDTRDTVHIWTQIVGKVRLALSPHVNHWWEVPLYISARGLTTSPIPCPLGIFEINFDFVEHKLDIVAAWGSTMTLRLYTRSVAGFYREFMQALDALGIQVKIWPVPQEVPNPILFDRDVTHARYDPACANRFWRVLASMIQCSKNFAPGLSAKSAPSISFGAVSIWPFRSSRAGALRNGRAPITSRATPTPTKWPAWDGGPAAATSTSRCSTGTPRPNHPASAKHARGRSRPTMTQSSVNSC